MPVTIYGSGPVTGVTSITGSGMDLITPTSVAGSGVTLSGGEVTFAGSTTVSANGVFTSQYETYRVIVRLLGSAADATGWRLRLAGTDNSTANWAYQSGFVSSGANNATQASALTTGRLCTHTTTDTSLVSLDLNGPALARNTAFTIMATRVATLLEIMGGLNAVATAFDGITLIPVSGNITGVMRIYGLRNS